MDGWMHGWRRAEMMVLVEARCLHSILQTRGPMNVPPLSCRDFGRMSVRGLDPTCPSTIKREPSSPSPSSQGDVSPAQPSPGSSSSDTNSSYGPLIKGHNHSNGPDSPSPYGHSAGLAGTNGATRWVGSPTANSSLLQRRG